ncbi:MAG: hypothetical protein ACT4NY_26360 [Pseudonocardiales bacterium]
MIVVDASVLVNVLADDEADGDRARARLLADPDLHAPSQKLVGAPGLTCPVEQL